MFSPTLLSSISCPNVFIGTLSPFFSCQNYCVNSRAFVSPPCLLLCILRDSNFYPSKLCFAGHSFFSDRPSFPLIIIVVSIPSQLLKYWEHLHLNHRDLEFEVMSNKHLGHRHKYSPCFIKNILLNISPNCIFLVCGLSALLVHSNSVIDCYI